MISRIRKILQVKKLTPSLFADRVGVPRSTISHVLSGRNNPSLEFIKKILETFPDIRMQWLINGEGSMLANSNLLFSDEETREKKQGDDFTFEKGQDAIQGDREPSKSSSEINIPVTPPSAPEILASGEDKDFAQSGFVSDKLPENSDNKSENKGKTGRKTVKVMIFYSDGTFSEYLPSQ